MRPHPDVNQKAHQRAYPSARQMTPPPRVLLLPGWLNAGPGHWRTRWEALYGHARVQQADWRKARRC